MSDSEDIYDAPVAPASAQSGKVAELARAFESCLRQPIMPQTNVSQLKKKTKQKLTIAPSGSGVLPDMELVKGRLRPVSVVKKQQPDDTDSTDNRAESTLPPLPPSAIGRRGSADNNTYSLRKPSARESMYPPQSPQSLSTSGGDPSSVIHTAYGSFRMVPLPPLDGAAAPDKPDIIDVDLHHFRRLTSTTYDASSDDIYDDIAADDASRDSLVSSRPDSRIVSTIPDMAEEDDWNDPGARGTVFEAIDSEEEGGEPEYDDVMHADGDIYQDIK